MKIAILIDALVNRGGVERIVLEQAKITNADLFVGRFYEDSTFPEFKKFKICPVTRFYKYKYGGAFGKLLTLHIWNKFSKLKLSGYDAVIIHGSGALNSAKFNHPNIWYCHSPSRYLYDLYDEEYKKTPFILKPWFMLITGIQRKIDKKNVTHLDKILVNSSNVSERVKKYYNLDAEILYPFVDTKTFRFIGQGDFYLSTARLDKIKRVDLIIKAFIEMPEKKLIIASDGPDRNNLINLAKKAKNISFFGYVSDEKLRDLYGRCMATIYLSYKEDFGMIPLESMAAGKPCIATNEGGFRETIIHKKTGFLVDDPNKTENVIAAVKWMTPYKCAAMRKSCEQQADKFSEKIFLKRTKKILSNFI